MYILSSVLVMTNWNVSVSVSLTYNQLMDLRL